MLIARNTIIICAIEILLSSLFYLCPSPAIIISSEQMNEFLLAIFGAGMGALATSMLDYLTNRRKLENRLFEQIEPLITSLSTIRRLRLESLGDGQCSDSLYLAYLEEEESNSLKIVETSHAQRTKLIQAVESCSEAECDEFKSDANSHFSRYLNRAKSTVDNIANNYLYLGAKLNSMTDIIRTIDEINYLTFDLCCRAKILKQIENELRDIQDRYRELVKVCNLYRLENNSQAALINGIREHEHNWVQSSSSSHGENYDALNLFSLASKFAQSTSSKYLDEYKGEPWW